MSTRKTAATKAALSQAAGRQKLVNDGLGREGGISRFFNEGILAGKSNADLTAAAHKKWPLNVIRPNYVAYCRAELVKRNLWKDDKAKAVQAKRVRKPKAAKPVKVSTPASSPAEQAPAMAASAAE